MLPCLMKTLVSCPPLTLITSSGEPSSFLLKRMGSTNKPTLLNMSPILKIPKLPKKISCVYTSKFQTRIALKSSYPTIHSWTSWNRVQNLKSWLMAILSSGESRLVMTHLTHDHPDYKGSPYNLLVEWETGEVTYETLTEMSMDDPVSYSEYGKKHFLLDKPGWKRLRRFMKTCKRLIGAIK